MLGLLAVVSLVLLFTLSACNTGTVGNTPGEGTQTSGEQGGAQGQGSDKSPKVVKMVLPLDGNILDPHVFTWYTYFSRMGIFEGLTKVDKEMKPIPANATSWTHNEDYTVWTFTLRDDLKWSDGTPLTAKDYEYSFKRAVDPATAAAYGKGSAFLTGVPLLNADEIMKGEKTPDTLGVKALDDRTLEVRLSKSWSMMDVSASEFWAVPVPKHIIDQYGKEWISPQNIVSNGPYKIADFQLGVHLKLAPNPNYYGKVNLDGIEIIKLDNEILPYQNGDINIASVKQADVEMVNNNPELKKQMQFYKTGIVYNLQLLPSENDILQKNPKVRQAISMSINKEVIANDIMKGTVRPGVSLVPEIFAPWGGEIGLKYDPNRAKALMAEAGFPEGKGFPEMTILLAGPPEGRELAIADMIEKGTGIKVKLVNYEWAKFVSEINKLQAKDTIGYYLTGNGTSVNHYWGYIRREDMWNIGKNLLPVDKYKQLMTINDDKTIDPSKKNKMMNDFIFENTTEVGKKYLSLIRESLQTTDPAKQEQLDREAAALREQEGVVIPIDWENGVKLVKPEIKGYVGNPLLLGAPPLYFNDLYFE